MLFSLKNFSFEIEKIISSSKMEIQEYSFLSSYISISFDNQILVNFEHSFCSCVLEMNKKQFIDFAESYRVYSRSLERKLHLFIHEGYSLFFLLILFNLRERDYSKISIEDIRNIFIDNPYFEDETGEWEDCEDLTYDIKLSSERLRFYYHTSYPCSCCPVDVLRLTLMDSSEEIEYSLLKTRELDEVGISQTIKNFLSSKKYLSIFYPFHLEERDDIIKSILVLGEVFLEEKLEEEFPFVIILLSEVVRLNTKKVFDRNEVRLNWNY